MNNMRMLSALMALSALMSTACNFAPRYDPPKAEMTPAFKAAVSGGEAAQGWKITVPSDAPIRDIWWEAYQDGQQDDLEAPVAISNQTMVAAEASDRAPQALYLGAQAQL